MSWENFEEASIALGKAIELLKVARCYNRTCVQGTITDKEGEPFQCQWCDERKTLIGEYEKS